MKDALEKAKEALNALYGWVIAEAEHFDANYPDSFIINMVEEALAALEAEKPLEDAMEISLRFFNGFALPRGTAKKLATDIEQYAEAHHQRKLAEEKRLAKVEVLEEVERLLGTVKYASNLQSYIEIMLSELKAGK